MRKRLVSLYLVRFFSLQLLISLYGVNHSCDNSLACAPREHEQAMQARTLIHQQLNILANDCDLSDKLFHACQDVVCAQSDKQGHAVITNH